MRRLFFCLGLGLTEEVLVENIGGCRQGSDVAGSEEAIGSPAGGTSHWRTK